MPTLPFQYRACVAMTQGLLGLLPKKEAVKGVQIREEAYGDIDLRIYQPEAPQSGAALLWIHGGGLMFGKPVQDDRLCVRVAKQLRVLVVSVDYRVAPRFPFPAAINDCYAAWEWVQRKAESLGLDRERVAIGGQSAGGGLAASLAQRLLNEGGVQPAAQWLFCPMLDDRTAANKALDDVRHLCWHNKSNRAGWTAYLGAAPGQPNVPDYAVPGRRENLKGLPPAWIGVGDIDLFYQEDKDYAERLEQQGVEICLHVAPMAPHGFESFAPEAPVAKAMLDSGFAFLLNHTTKPSC